MWTDPNYEIVDVLLSKENREQKLPIFVSTWEGELLGLEFDKTSLSLKQKLSLKTSDESPILSFQYFEASKFIGS